MTNKKVKYSEPAEYFPKEIRKKYRLGEYAETSKEFIMDDGWDKEVSEFVKKEKGE